MKFQRMHFGKKKERITLFHLNKPLKNGGVGVIVSPLFADRIAVVIDQRPETVRDFDIACLARGKNGSGQQVQQVMLDSETYYDIKRGKAYARTALLHELGHYYNNTSASCKANRDDERIQRVLKEEVCEEELLADMFAVEHLNAQVVTSGLQQIKEMTVNRYTGYDPEDIGVIIHELDLRIERIRL